MNNQVRILIIDDNKADVKMIEIFLHKVKNKEEFTFTHYLSLEQGLHQLQQQEFDVLLLDLSLRDHKGVDCIYSARRVSDISIIVLTGEEDDAIGMEAIRAGAQDFLIKSQLNPYALDKTIRFAFERSKLTERVKKSYEQYKLLLESLPDSVVIMSPNFIIQSVNNAFINLVQDTWDNIVDKSVADFIYDKSQFEACSKLVSEGVAITDKEIELINRKSLKPISCIVSCKPYFIEYENKHTFQMMVKDISERKQLESVIRKKELAEFSLDMERKFLTNVSHELRTPLNVITGINHLLLESNLGETQKNYVKNQKLAADNLLGLVSNLLDYSQFNASKISLDYTTIDFHELLTKIYNSFNDNIENNNVKCVMEIDKNIPQYIKSDANRLQTIISNLLNNSIKFTENGLITLSIELADNLIQLQVKDTGIGIPEIYLKDIFKSFIQLPTSNNTKLPGAGLGLAVTNKIVNLFGGTIEIESEVNVGTCIIVKIPYLKADEEEIIALSDAINDEIVNIPLRFLIVEDHLPNQLLTKTFLQNWFKFSSIDIAANGNIALDLLSFKKFDLILMDLQMPIMDGYETCVVIRGSKQPYNNIPIIAMTAHALRSEMQRCKDIGMNEFVSKPVDPTTLKNKILLALNEQSTIEIDIDESTNNTKEVIVPEECKVDLSYIDKLSMNNDVIKLSLIQQLAIDAPSECLRLGELLHRQEWKELGALAHKMKATASYLGLPMKDFFNELINNARTEQNLEKIPEQVSVVLRNFEACLVDLNEIVNSLKDKLRYENTNI